MNKYICEFCNKEFSSKPNLCYHIKNAKYCMNLRGEIKEDDSYVCNYCNKSFTTNKRLNTHINICDKYKEYKILIEKDEIIQSLEKSYKEKLFEKDIQIQKLEEQLKNLQDTYNDIFKESVSRPTTVYNNKNNNNNTVNNTQYNNLSPVFFSQVQKIFNERLTQDDIMEGQKGLAKFTIKNLLLDEDGKYKAVCCDRARKVILYKKENGEIIKDPQAYNLVSSISNALNTSKKNIISKFQKRYYKQSGRDLIHKDKDEIYNEDELLDDYRSDLSETEEEDGSIWYRISFSKTPEQKLDKFRKYKEKVISLKKKEVEGIRDYSTNYEKARVDYDYNKLLQGSNDCDLIDKNSTTFSKILSISLPQEPK